MLASSFPAFFVAKTGSGLDFVRKKEERKKVCFGLFASSQD